jgi:hypothetical protein
MTPVRDREAPVSNSSSPWLYMQQRHFKAWPRTSGPLSPYTLRKYRACGGDLAQHGRGRIDQCCDLFADGVPATGWGGGMVVRFLPAHKIA